MAFIFSTSHLPETRVRRPDHLEDEEEDDTMQPMPRAGGVRAFSHLPQPADAQADFEGPLSTRPATPVGRPRPHTDPDDDQDTGHAPAPDSDPEGDTAPQDHADDRPWYMPRITAQDLPPQDHPEDAHAPAPKPWENTARSSRFDGTPPADRSAFSTRDNGFSPTPQDLRDAFHSSAPDTLTGEARTQDSRPALTRGRIFEKRLPPMWPAPQQRGRTSDASQKSQDSGFSAAGPHTTGTTTAPSGRMPEEHLSVSGEPEHGGLSGAQNPNRRRRQTGEMTGAGTSSPRTFSQLAAPPATPKNKKYFVFPKNENVVILYNKKAVENLYHQYSSGTAMGQQGLSMLQDYSGSTSNPRLIDISDPGWVRKLDALAAANKDKGGFTHLVILDHGIPADQHFGRFPGSYENETALTPESAAWRVIASVMAPDGHIHFGGCRVARHQHGRNYLNEMLHSLGKGSKITIDGVTGPMFNQANQFEGDLIQAQPLP